MESRYGWVVVAAGALITCVAMGAMFALPVYLQPMAADTGWSRAGISIAMTVGFIVMGFAGFGWGVLSDRIGTRPVLLLATLLGGAGLVLASRASDILVFQFAYGGLVGASGGAFFAPIAAATVGWFDRHRSLAVSLVSVGSGVAPMTMTPLATVLIGAYGWRTAMLAIALAYVAIVVPAALLIRPAPVPAAAPRPAAGPAPSTPGGNAWSAFRTPQFIVLAITFFFCCGAHSGPIFHTVSYAMLCGASPLAAASIYSVEGLSGLFGRLLFGVLADRFDVRRVIVGGLALQAVGIYLYIYVGQVPQFYLMALFLGLAYGGVMPLYSVLARQYFAQNVMGTVLGAASITSFLGMALGPVGGGWLYDTFGTYHWLYIASASLGAVAAAMALAFPAPRRDLPLAPQPA
ncbi:MAG TPA: MFS transporter [Devosia sp.]|nr:MFS transporter [Devosia sp.]